jgi:DNA-binding winged helix-turn-helix (wHTH) protein
MDRIELAQCIVDLRLEQFERDGETITLTSREAEILRYLAERPRQPVSREDLLTEVWGFSPQVISRAPDTAMRRLRGKLEADPANPRHFITIHGFGYRFEPLFAAAPVSRENWAPTGCPTPGADASALLSTARQTAEERGDGFVGLEHLLLALERHPVEGEGADHARAILRGGRFEVRLAQLVPSKDERQPDWRGTPRLQTIVAGLSDDFGAEVLMDAIAREPARGLQAIDLEFSLLEVTGSPWGQRTVQCVEIAGGPEDGRRLRPKPNEWIGRAWPGHEVDHGLYAECVLEDATISRRGDLLWLGDGRVRLRRGGTHYPWDLSAFLPGATRGSRGAVLPPQPVPGDSELTLSAGDLLCLHATVLRALP